MQQHEFRHEQNKKKKGAGVHDAPSVGMLNDGRLGGGAGAYRVVTRGRGGGASVLSSELATVGDHDLAGRFAALAAFTLHPLDHIHPFHHLPEHHMLPVKPAGRRVVSVSLTQNNQSQVLTVGFSTHESHFLKESRRFVAELDEQLL